MRPLRPTDPRWIGPYRLLGRLGSGGSGQVYLARSPGGRPVAVKVVHGHLAASERFRVRFAREAAAARRVGGFHTAQVVDLDPDADPPWLVTAYVPGPSLRDAVQEHGPLPPAMVTALGAGLAEGLAAVHAAGLVHRDLKPGNVVLAADGPRIIDFGIAHALDASELTASGAVLGTPAYMSPEQARGEDVGPSSDVFALGCVLAYAARGRSPFEGATQAVAIFRILHEEPDLDGIGGELRELVAACLAKEAGDRPPVPEVLRRFEAWTGEAAAWSPPPGPAVTDAVTDPVGAPRRRRRVALAAASAAVAALALVPAGVWWTIPQGEAEPRAGTVPPVSSTPSWPAASSAVAEDAPKPSPPARSTGAGGREPSKPSATPSEPAEKCRPYVPVKRARAAIGPCIRTASDGLVMTVNVKALEPAGTRGRITVWVWISNPANTKYRASLNKCRMTLTSDEDEGVCGPYTYLPSKAGTYHVAASASAVDAALPPEWPPQFTGTGSPDASWPS